MSLGERRKVEAKIKKREAYEMKTKQNLRMNKRVPAYLKEDSHDSISNEEVNLEIKKRRENYFEGLQDLYNQDNKKEEHEARFYDLEKIRGKLVDWINEELTKNFIKKSFSNFLLKFRDKDNVLVYEKRINEMCS